MARITLSLTEVTLEAQVDITSYYSDAYVDVSLAAKDGGWRCTINGTPAGDKTTPKRMRKCIAAAGYTLVQPQDAPDRPHFALRADTAQAAIDEVLKLFKGVIELGATKFWYYQHLTDGISTAFEVMIEPNEDDPSVITINMFTDDSKSEYLDALAECGLCEPGEIRGGNGHFDMMVFARLTAEAHENQLATYHTLVNLHPALPAQPA